jgi:hypothetical protein
MGKTHIFTAWKTPAEILSEIAPEIGAVVNSRHSYVLTNIWVVMETCT